MKIANRLFTAVLVLFALYCVGSWVVNAVVGPEFLAFDARRKSWFKHCSQYRGQVLVTDEGRACNAELKELAALAEQEGLGEEMTRADIEEMLTHLAATSRYMQESSRLIRESAEHIVQVQPSHAIHHHAYPGRDHHPA